jgi:hypothetical protein
MSTVPSGVSPATASGQTLTEEEQALPSARALIASNDVTTFFDFILSPSKLATQRRNCGTRYATPGATTIDSAERIGMRPVMNEARPAVQLADLIPNLQHPEDPLPTLKGITNPHGAQGGGG